MSLPISTFSEDFHRHVWAPEGAEMTLERFTEGKDRLAAEVEIRTTRPPAPGLLLGPVSLNLLADRSLTGMAKGLELRQGDVDWDGLLRQAAHLSIARYRQGEPLVDLVALSRVEEEAIRFVVRPFWEWNPSVLFGDGDAGKSSIAVALAASIASGIAIVGDEVLLHGRVLYLDWEADARTHAVRLGAILRGAGIELEDGQIEYKRMFTSLKEVAKDTRRAIVEHGFVAAVVDSLGGAKGEDAETNKGSIEAFNAIRQLGVPTYIVDHVTHDSVRRAGNDVPMVSFGGRYTRNYARLMWGMIASKPSEESTFLYQRLKMRKGNNVGQQAERVQRMAYEMEGDRLVTIRFEPWQAAAVPEFRAAAGAWERMRDLMLKERRGLTVVEFMEALGLERSTVQRTLERHTDDTLNQAQTGKPGAYVLRARQYEAVGTHSLAEGWGEVNEDGIPFSLDF